MTATSRTLEYGIWNAMKRRCYNHHCREFSRYGARGISVCDRWRDSFAAFMQDMGPRPSKDHSIDRKDGRGNYEPENCRWATRTEQMRNKLASEFVTAFGKTKMIVEWSETTGIDLKQIWCRLHRLRWKPERAVSEPIRPMYRTLTANGTTKTIQEWASLKGFNRWVIDRRLELGWSEQEAVCTPVGH